MTRDNWLRILALHKAGLSQTAIAAQLSVSQTAIGRELSRNRAGRGYCVKQAQAKAEARHAAHGMPRVLAASSRATVTELLCVRRLSPEQISAKLAVGGVAISHESICRMI